ncbi:MAG: hypothetical protein EOS57_08195 [Mesorhizobium sp.]|nr:MAG: hypothetical protein EOS57_08195 [Mesorhizobium sp.]
MVNWRRGGWRLWIVGSLIWIAAVGWYYSDYLGVALEKENGFFVWELDAAHGRRMNDNTEINRLSASGAYVRYTPPDFPEAVLLLPANGLEPSEVNRRTAETNRILLQVRRVVHGMFWDTLETDFAPKAFGPPIAVLVGFWVFGWVGAGFRRS